MMKAMAGCGLRAGGQKRLADVSPEFAVRSPQP
jgi:hypothetical protein